MSESITFAELEEACALVANQREVVAELSAAKKREDEVLEKLELKVLEILKALGKTSYQSNIGTVGLAYRQSVKLPQTPADREAFFDYLKAMGVYDTMIGVNSNTLNRFYKDEFEKAKERGDFDFSIPGIGEPTMTEIFSLKKS